MPTPRQIAAAMHGLAGTLMLTALPLAAQEPPGPEDGAFISTVTFTCERGVTVPVAYVSTAGGPGFAVMQIDGRQIAMHQIVSASGTRYRSIDADQPYLLHGKGQDGFIAYGAGDDAPILLGECHAE